MRAARVMADQSNSVRGPVLSGAMDTKTGRIFFGQNALDLPSRLHPQIRASLDRWREVLNGTRIPFKGEPGTHGEIFALNEGLYARPGAKIEDFIFYSVRLKGAAKGDPIVMCPNCRAITWPAKDLVR